jgi:colanic acid/amylovoran biosynthesis glycosyltransferase
MRIAFVIGQFPVTSKTFIVNQITGLIDRGHEVDIYAVIPEYKSVLHPDIEKYNLLDHTYYYYQFSLKFLPRIRQKIELLLTSLWSHPQVSINSLNVLKYGRDAISLKVLSQAFPIIRNKLSYDIIHCHFGQNGLQGLRLRDIGAFRGKLIVSFHGADVTQYVEKNGDALYQELFKQGDLFSPISEHWKRQLIRLGCDESKIVVHRMGIDCDRFTFIPRHIGADGRVRCVTVSRLVEKKGIEYGIRAVSQLVKANKNIEYIIIGDGPLREELQQLIQQLEVGSAIRLLGWKHQQDVVEMLKESDIMLAPSVTSQDGDQEGIPVALMEAMAMGMPVVSTHHSGIPELIQDGVSGFLVPERDVEALAKQLSYLVEHPEVWSAMGYAGRKNIEDSYNIDKLNDQLVSLYQALLT